MESIKHRSDFVGAMGNSCCKNKTNKTSKVEGSTVPLTPISKYLGRFQETGAGAGSPLRAWLSSRFSVFKSLDSVGLGTQKA